ncbi:hypothetical protein ACTMTI_06085 [Nonomuraea sp. H19]|uniref:hypothetical protein n=1 Tax=Nonomuraea sp. H19 TaxID=3452206 RepID=UPI003F8CAB77
MQRHPPDGDARAIRAGRTDRRLMLRAFGWAAADHPGRDLYLEVLRDNAPARAFYERMGGEPGKEFVEQAAGGVELDVVEYTWSPPAMAAASR